MSDTDRGVIYEFGSFRVDPSKRQLFSNKEPVHLTAKAFDTLLILIQQAGETVSKTDILNKVWSDVIVEEINLTQQISTIRKALGERPGEHTYILTVPGRGHSFIAAITETASDAEASPEHERPRLSLTTRFAVASAVALAAIVILFTGIFWAHLRRAISTRPTQTIGVLPFRSLDTDDDLLEAGIRDTLTAKLGNLQELNVRPTSTAASYLVQDPLAAGRELHVDAILNGTIQHDGEQIRVTVQMLDVVGGKIMWGKSFDSRVSASFAVQDSISAEIVKGVEEYYAAN